MVKLKDQKSSCSFVFFTDRRAWFWSVLSLFLPIFFIATVFIKNNRLERLEERVRNTYIYAYKTKTQRTNSLQYLQSFNSQCDVDRVSFLPLEREVAQIKNYLKYEAFHENKELQERLLFLQQNQKILFQQVEEEGVIKESLVTPIELSFADLICFFNFIKEGKLGLKAPVLEIRSFETKKLENNHFLLENLVLLKKSKGDASL